MIKKQAIITFLLASYVLTSTQPSCVNDNQHTILQDITITLSKKKNKTDCTDLCGQKLKDCLNCQTKESFLQNILELDDLTALAYWRSLTLQEYIDAIDNFTPEEWDVYYQSRDTQYRQCFPSTLFEQRKILKNLHRPWGLYATLKSFFTREVDQAQDYKKAIEHVHTLCKTIPELSDYMTELASQFESHKQHLFKKGTS